MSPNIIKTSVDLSEQAFALSSSTSDLIPMALTNQTLRNYERPSSSEQPQETSSHPSNEQKHIPRPANSFMCFRAQRHRSRSATEKELTVGKFSAVASGEWRRMSPEEKQPWIYQAMQLKAEHEARYPDYKYKPRKKSAKVSLNISSVR